VESIKVLIVDDSPAARDGLQSILRAPSDIDVVGEAADGLEAAVKAEQLRPTIILMDAQMPGMDGVEATRQIKEQLPGVKILFLAVHTPYVEGALAAGADACLMKDCGRQELLQAIRRLAGRE
jgi:DNA-binding NarL/FixJ family response regulator